MDRKLSHHQKIQQLIRSSDAARQCLEKEAILLRQKLDVPARLQSSLKAHPTGWLVGSLFSGMGASLLFRRKSAPVEKKKRSFPIALLGLTLTAVRPLAKMWLADQAKNYLSHRLNPPPHQPRSSANPLIR
jgi:hypothetical protein